MTLFCLRGKGIILTLPLSKIVFYVTFFLSLLNKAGVALLQIYRFKNMSQILGLSSFQILIFLSKADIDLFVKGTYQEAPYNVIKK